MDQAVLTAFLFCLALAAGLTLQQLPAIISSNPAPWRQTQGPSEGDRGAARLYRKAQRMTVFCSDKTGTLMEGTVRLNAVCPERLFMEMNSRSGRFFLPGVHSNGSAPAQEKVPVRRRFRLVSLQSFGLRRTFVWLGASLVFPSIILAATLDQLPDLTDKAAQAVVTLKGRDNFNSEYSYDVSVKNLSSDPLVGDSLVIVLDKITNIGGDEWSAGTSESNLSRMEILGQDGVTDDGKPYFRIPRGSGPDLPPYSESSPATVRIRNKDYLIVFTPFFRVYGLKRTPPPPKPKERVSPTPPAKTPTDKLIQMLIQKGVLSEEEGRALYQP